MMTNSPEVRNSLLYMILYSQHNPDEMYGNEFASYENNDFHWFFFMSAIVMKLNGLWK